MGTPNLSRPLAETKIHTVTILQTVGTTLGTDGIFLETAATIPGIVAITLGTVEISLGTVGTTQETAAITRRIGAGSTAAAMNPAGAVKNIVEVEEITPGTAVIVGLARMNIRIAKVAVKTKAIIGKETCLYMIDLVTLTAKIQRKIAVMNMNIVTSPFKNSLRTVKHRGSTDLQTSRQ